MNIKSKEPEPIIMQRMGKFAQNISSSDVRCLRDMLDNIFSITAPISCDVVVYIPSAAIPSSSADHIDGRWYGVSERTVKDLEQFGYPKHPIASYLEMLNKNGIQEDHRLENLLSNSQVAVDPVTIVHNSHKRKVLVVAVRIAIELEDKCSGVICCVVLINPIHVTNRPDQNKRLERIDPITGLVEAWLSWLNFKSSRLKDKCQDMLDGNRHFDEANKLFRSLIRLHTLSDIITFVNKSLLFYGKKNMEEHIQWLKEEVIRYIDPPRLTGEYWHNCMRGHWPPCHKGKFADRELAKVLLYFCPWTSGALQECEEVPQELDNQWRKVIRDRLWGWTPLPPPYHYVESRGVNPRLLNEKSLTYLFVAEFLEADSRSPYLDDYVTSKERGRYLMHVGRVLHYLLAGTSLDWSTIEGLVWMIAEYGHRHLGIDPRLDIASHLLQAARAEPALHAMQAYYRDHFFHAVEVCFLGHMLLITKDRSGKYLWEHVVQNLRALQGARKGSKKTGPDQNDVPATLVDVLRQWYVTALFHDVGYTIQIFRALQNMLKFYSHPDEMKVFQSDLAQALKKLSDSICESSLGPTLELNKLDIPGGDHGVVAATHLKSLLSRLGDDKKPGNYEPAIRAIGVHNNRRATVNFQTEPIGFLLILCDTIQEWNRPHLRYTTAPSMLLARLLGKEERFENTTGPLDTVSLNVERTSQPSPRPKFQITQGGVLKILLTYDHQIQKDSGVFNLWIDSSCNLQRLRLDSLPFNITISFRTPQFHSGRDIVSQMDRLRDAATETHMHFLHDWLPSSTTGRQHDKVNKTNSVRLSTSSSYDELTLDLRRLSKVKTIAGTISQFRERLQNWKHYSEDRDFEGDYTPIIPGK